MERDLTKTLMTFNLTSLEHQEGDGKIMENYDEFVDLELRFQRPQTSLKSEFHGYILGMTAFDQKPLVDKDLKD